MRGGAQAKEKKPKAQKGMYPIDKKELMSLADRLKQKGSSVDAMRGGAQAKDKNQELKRGMHKESI